MNKLLTTTLAATTLALATHAAFAEDQVRENRPVDAKVTRIRLGGVVTLNVHQGATPSLVISGGKSLVARTTTTQHGDTLDIGNESESHFSWHSDSDKLVADLTVPNLQEFSASGVGNSTVTGFSGDKVRVSMDGAGSLTMNSRYRVVDAALGGVGGVTLNNGGTADRVDLSLRGAGRMTITGETKVLHGTLSGVGSLDATNLRADSVELRMSGMGSANVFARSAANLNLSGLGSASVYGNPATRNAATSGMGKVSWK
ncbi:hypothetical protein GCM10027321_22120 [Massilia terrae]|uniref:DUF2807 domain-containing protein n=1 Tax=Massilia terrae TaxID=1811224 RepID=A0ABT2CYF2_9BURK|nr:DUF2807 domain-containing protein [Massilia terrae]MCS0658894.1 DUF2807 domain-containing protein [Massilia terrae]